MEDFDDDGDGTLTKMIFPNDSNETTDTDEDGRGQL